MDSRTVSNEALFPEVDAMLREGREVEFRPKGSSMLPFIRGEADSVVVARKEEIAEGDIVLAKIGGRYILHRVIKIEGEKITMMGDGNVRGTEACSKSDVLGTVVQIVAPSGKVRIPGKGRLWKALRPVRRYLLAIYRRI